MRPILRHRHRNRSALVARPPRPATGPLSLLLAAIAHEDGDKDAATEGDPILGQGDDRVTRARALIRDAIARTQGVSPRAAGPKVDKYFGTKLPPVCAQLGCYVTDDGKRFYCVNAACQKHKQRETKHTRKGNPEKSKFIYFKCPRCSGRDVEMHILANKYLCHACRYNWDA